MSEAGAHALSVRRDAWDQYNDAVQRRMAGTVWNDGGCASYYVDRKGRNTSLLPDFTFRFRRLMERFDPHAWERV
jgi:hypothetical protein